MKHGVKGEIVNGVFFVVNGFSLMRWLECNEWNPI